MSDKPQCACGRPCTHFTIDGGDSVMCCADYPNCTPRHPSLGEEGTEGPSKESNE